ncbi:MAG: hypothetical protein AAGA70_14710 [Pseudomonadota bacterium]
MLLGLVLATVVPLWRGLPAVIGVFRPLTVWRINPLWFVVAILWPILFSAAFVTTKALVLGEPLSLLSSGAELLGQPSFLATVFIAALIGEIVWVGYAIANLGRMRSRVISALIVGAVWGLWWLPMSYFEIGIVPGLTLASLWMSMTGVAFFCAFFDALTRSGLVIFAMQFCFNSSVVAFPLLPIHAGPWAFEAYSAAYMIVGFLFVAILLPRLESSRSEQEA